MAVETHDFQLLEPASPEALVPAHSLWPWFAAAVAIAILLIALWRLLRKRKPAAAGLAARRKAAFHKAKAALANPGPATCREAATVTSLVLREYLSAAAEDPALFETHEEFISRHDSLQALTPQARAAAEAGFTRLAALKYAPGTPEADPAQITAEARTLLETLHHGFAA